MKIQKITATFLAVVLVTGAITFGTSVFIDDAFASGDRDKKKHDRYDDRDHKKHDRYYDDYERDYKKHDRYYDDYDDRKHYDPDDRKKHYDKDYKYEDHDDPRGGYGDYGRDDGYSSDYGSYYD